MCDCPFCTHIPREGVLPFPVCIPIHPHEHFAAWGWLTSNNGSGRMVIEIMDKSKRYRFVNTSNMIQFLRTLFPNQPEHGMQAVDIQKSINGISIRVSENAYTPMTVKVSSALPIGETRDLPTSIMSVECQSRAPRSIDAEYTTSGRSATKNAPKNAPKRQRTVAASSSVASPPRSPMRIECTDSYDISIIGGDRYEMQRIAVDFPMWNEEVVQFVLNNGGRPPLVNISGGTPLEHFCAFRAPNGMIVHNVRVPRSIITVLYDRE